MSKATSSTYTTPALTKTTYYRVAASCNGSSWDYSKSVTLTVNNANLYVGKSGAADAAGYGSSSAKPYATLKHALKQATCGDIINVASGT